MKSILLLVAAVVVAGCSGGTTEPTTPPTDLSPSAVVSQWLDAVVAVDVAALADLVEPGGLAVIAGVENSVRSDELVGLLNGGFKGDLAAGYWRTFRDDFAAIRGGSLENLIVVDETPVAGNADFVAVGVLLDETTGSVLVRQTEAGWRVDMAATVGPALVDPLSDYLSSALSGSNAIPISDAYRSSVIPALDAAIVLDETNADLVFGTEYLRQLIEG